MRWQRPMGRGGHLSERAAWQRVSEPEGVAKGISAGRERQQQWKAGSTVWRGQGWLIKQVNILH